MDLEETPWESSVKNGSVLNFNRSDVLDNGVKTLESCTLDDLLKYLIARSEKEKNTLISNECGKILQKMNNEKVNNFNPVVHQKKFFKPKPKKQ